MGILLIIVALVLTASLVSHSTLDWPNSSRSFDEPYRNWIGWLGAFISHHLFAAMGLTAYALALFMLVTGGVLFMHAPVTLLAGPAIFSVVGGIFLPLLIALTVDIGSGNTLVEPAFRFGGVFGGMLAHTLVSFLGKLGTYLLALGAVLITVVMTTNIRLSSLAASLMQAIKSLGAKLMSVFEREEEPPGPVPDTFTANQALPSPGPLEDETPFLTPLDSDLPETLPESSSDEPMITLPAPEPEAVYDEPDTADTESGDDDYRDMTEQLDAVPADYQLPGPDLLNPPTQDGPAESREELLDQARRIVESLKHFNIDAEVKNITPGPIVTRYEITLAPGIKVGRVVGLSNDLTMALRAKGGIRIIAPIPGKAAIGIEVPNTVRSTVYLREIVESEAFQTADRPLVLAVGKNTAGDPVVADLAKMPHLLIAGSTGSGKSVCINTIIASILMNATPRDVRMIMVDPKVVELNIYNDIPHLLTPVITDPKRAAGALRWAVREMESRYRRLAALGVRDIEQYNARVETIRAEAAEENASRGEDDTEAVDGDVTTVLPERLPLIVIIIDEFADLMVLAAKEIEESIARLAQMARAVGMHLILATQRPSADVITGLIKANFPSRIAFKVMQASNSRIILDESGADKLLGMGDMLFLKAGRPESVRMHGAFISNDECSRIVGFIRDHADITTDRIDEGEFDDEPVDTGNALGLRDPNDRDVLFFEAARLVVRHSQGSVSLLQRRLKIGYARAARLIDQLELAGIVSAYDGSKAREVLVDDMYLDALEDEGL